LLIICQDDPRKKGDLGGGERRKDFQEKDFLWAREDQRGNCGIEGSESSIEGRPARKEVTASLSKSFSKHSHIQGEIFGKKKLACKKGEWSNVTGGLHGA